MFYVGDYIRNAIKNIYASRDEEMYKYLFRTTDAISIYNNS